MDTVRERREERTDHRDLARPPPTVGFKARGFQPADHDIWLPRKKSPIERFWVCFTTFTTAWL